jgi:hypothetical protein
MTITFENNNDIIVYALEKVIAYATRTQQIFVVQCVWWLASVVGLESGLVTHSDNLRERTEVDEPLRDPAPGLHTYHQLGKVVSPTPRDIQEDLRSPEVSSNIHPDRRAQVEENQYISDIDLNGSEEARYAHVLKNTKQYIKKSQKEWKALRKQADSLSQTRLGKVIVKPLTVGQRKYLQCLSKDTIAAYLTDRK